MESDSKGGRALLAPSSPASTSLPHNPGSRHSPAAGIVTTHSDQTILSEYQDDVASTTTSAKLQALLPRPTEQPPPPRPITSTSRKPAAAAAVPRRAATIVACENCRAKRTKCDGLRPKCSRCARLCAECEYDAGPDETRSIARKRKYDEMKSNLNDMQELYEYLRTRPMAEVTEVIRRIRSNNEPYKVLRLLREGDLLLQASAIGRRGLEADVDDVERELDEAAYRRSRIKVPAKPWTDVGGDGLVSELVTIFFDVEQPFAATYVDRRCFLREMRSQDVQDVKFCSPLLVNAICAMSAFTSETARAIDLARGGCTRTRFYDEAKRLLDLEVGRVSIPSIMALYTLFLCASEAGMDRAGALYRISCSEMFKRLKLGTEFPCWVDKSDPGKRESYRRGVSRASWGLFCMDSMGSLVYNQPTAIPIPTLPRLFDDGKEDLPPEEDDARDVLGAQCAISVLLDHIMCYNQRTLVDDADKVAVRLSYYQKALELEMPPRRLPSQGMLGLGQSLFLEIYYSVMIIALFRPLVSLDPVLPDGGLPSAVCIQHCQRIEERLQEIQSAYPQESAGGCVGTLFYSYICCFTLLPLLNKHPSSHDPFVERCRYFSLVSKFYEVGLQILRGLQALALEAGITLPPRCAPYFAKANLANQNFRDVPVSYVVPFPVSFGEQGGDMTGLDLGALIEKWSSTMSL